MTIDEALKQLKSDDPETRRQAIIAIGKTKNASALRVLADVYQSDPDPDLRALALKAGKYIKANLAPAGAAPAAPVAPAHVSGVDRERAASFLSQALDYHMKDNLVRAAEMLGRAFDHNPELTDDPLAKNLAADLTGQGPTPALRMFMDREARAQFIASKGGRVAPNATGAMSWGSAFVDLGIYGLAQGAYVFIIMMIGAQAVFRVIQDTARARGQALPPQMAGLLQTGVTVPMAIGVGVAAAVVAVIGLLIQSSIVHTVAKTTQGGVGLLPSLVHKLAFLAIVAIPLTAAVGLPQLLIADRTVHSLLSVASAIVSLGLWYYTSKLIGQNYSFSTGKGCVTLILSSVVLIVVFVCCAFTLSIALAGLIGSPSRPAGI